MDTDYFTRYCLEHLFVIIDGQDDRLVQGYLPSS